MRNRVLGFGVLLILGLILNQCTSAKRSDSGQITESGDVSVFEIQVGDCFNELPSISADGSPVSSVGGVPCNQAHHWESFYKGTLATPDFSQLEINQEASEICQDADLDFANRVSASKILQYSEAELTLSVPTFKSWTLRGDRSVDCFIGSETETYSASFLD